MIELPHSDGDGRALHITRTHMDELGYCARGARRWAERMGLSWTDFVFHGIDSDILLATGDAMAQRLVEHVMSCKDGIQQDRSGGGIQPEMAQP